MVDRHQMPLLIYFTLDGWFMHPSQQSHKFPPHQDDYASSHIGIRRAFFEWRNAESCG